MRGKLWCLDDSVRTSPKLVGSRAAEVSIYQKRSKEGTVVKQRQGQSLVLMHVGSEGFPVWSNPTDAAGSDRKVSVHNYLLCMGLHSCWRVRVPMLMIMSIPESANMGTWSSERNHGAIEEGGLVWWTPFVFFLGGFFCIMWMDVCVRVTYLRNTCTLCIVHLNALRK